MPAKYRPGALGAGNDIESGEHTLAEATARATQLPGCVGFTFANPASGPQKPKGKLLIFFKSSAEGNADPAWSTYLVKPGAKPAEGPPPSPAMLLMEKAGYDPVKQATLEVITSALANPVSGPLAESAEQCVEDTQASANTIILQTIAAADWEGGYKLSLMQNLARRVGLAGGKPACISNIRNRC